MEKAADDTEKQPQAEPVDKKDADSPASTEKPATQAPPVVNVYAGAPSPQQPASAQPQSQSLQSPAAAPINVPRVPATPSVLNPDGTMNPGATAETAQTGIGLGQKVDTEAAKAKANYDQQYLDETQRLKNLDAQHLQEMQSHTCKRPIGLH